MAFRLRRWLARCAGIQNSALLRWMLRCQRRLACQPVAPMRLVLVLQVGPWPCAIPAQGTRGGDADQPRWRRRATKHMARPAAISA